MVGNLPRKINLRDQSRPRPFCGLQETVPKLNLVGSPSILVYPDALPPSGESTMKRSIAAIIVFSTVTTGIAANATSIVAQNQQIQSCAIKCQGFFNQCLQLCGQNCTTAGISAAITAAATANAANPNPTTGSAATGPTVFRNCDSEQNLCLIGCQASPNG